MAATATKFASILPQPRLSIAAVRGIISSGPLRQNTRLRGHFIRCQPLTSSTNRHQEHVSNQDYESQDSRRQHKAPPTRSARFWDAAVGAILPTALAIGGIIVADEYYDLKMLSGLGIEYSLFSPNVKMQWLERRVWAAARAADNVESWRECCFAATRVRLVRQDHIPFEEVEIPSKQSGWWGGGNTGDVLDGEDVKLFLVRDGDQIVRYFCIVMNADFDDPNIRAKEVATIKHVFDRKLTFLRETGQIKNGCIWEFWTRDKYGGTMSWSWRKTRGSGNDDRAMLSDYFSKDGPGGSRRK